MKYKAFLFGVLGVFVVLGAYDLTGDAIHIAAAVIGLVILIAFTIKDRKNWEKPAMEILMRVMFATAFLTGIPLFKDVDIPVLIGVHRVTAIIFALMLISLYARKAFSKQQ